MSRGEWKNSGEGECNLRSKTAGSEGFSGQNRQNCPSLNKKQNHNPNLFFSDLIKQYHITFGGLEKLEGSPLDSPLPPSLRLRSQ